MFVTPIMWPITALGESTLVANINPLYHMIDLVRAPMLGHAPSHLSWVVAIGCACIGWTIAILLLCRATRRLIFWL
jgi:ABC-type polysaccharide/polyol phosphate export permease